MPIQQIPASCEGCGACCYGLVVEVREADFAEYGTPRELVTVVPDPEGGDPLPALKQVESDHKRCIALDPETRRCTIYEQRPQTCRDFQRGDDPAKANPLCFEVVEDMRVLQGRRATAEPRRLRAVTTALQVLTGDDVDAASIGDQMEFLRHATELREGVLLTLVAVLQSRAQEAEIEVTKLKRDIVSLRGMLRGAP